MRIRAVRRSGVARLPAALSAQRIPLPIGRRGPTVIGGREPRRQPAPIANELATR